MSELETTAEQRGEDVLAWWSNRLGSPPCETTEQACAAGGPSSLLLSISRPAMACDFEVLLNQHQHARGAEQAMSALDLIELLENKFSVYKPHSDLSLLNRFGAIRPVAVSTDTLALLQLAQDIHALTSGAFDITAGSLSDAWGFARRQGAMPTAEAIAQALDLVGSHLLKVDASRGLVSCQRANVKTNPGGIGKGYALDRASRHLTDAGINDFMMHGGLSSVVARGSRQFSTSSEVPASYQGGWLVSLRHPWRHEELLGTIRLRNKSLATSGSGKQFFHFGGKRYSHIIDPRSGWPAQGMLSVTVISRSGAVADALATAMFVMGIDAISQFCQTHSTVAAIAVLTNPKSGRTHIETFNLEDGQWSPHAVGID